MTERNFHPTPHQPVTLGNRRERPTHTNQQFNTPEPNPNEDHTVNESNNNQGSDNFLTEIFKFAIIALVIVIPFRMFIAQPFIVSGASMSPTFETGQYLIIDQVSYQLDNPERGDVVIFKFPEDPSKFFIKRVIGLPGETVELHGTDVIVKDVAEGTQINLSEPYLKNANRKEDFLTITLEREEYFVMGDNRAASSDSRIWGPVPKDLIVGRAFVRLLPLGELELFPGLYRLPAIES